MKSGSLTVLTGRAGLGEGFSASSWGLERGPHCQNPGQLGCGLDDDCVHDALHTQLLGSTGHASRPWLPPPQACW